MIGTVINDRYEITSLIGRGGMGNVYLAQDRQTAEQIALKHLKPEFIANDPEIVERFKREAEILRELDHPNIVNIRDAIFDDDAYYIVMDYIDGGTLDTLIADETALPIKRVLEIGLGIADALTRAHHLKIVHRDIKPANILLDHDGTPLLTDFGVAHAAGRTRMTEIGSVIGTYAYLSPEACDGREPDERADIWSFGVVLFELLTGRRPFEGDKPATIITQILTADVPDVTTLRPDTPPALADLLHQMLQKNPDARIGSVRRIGSELEEILQGTTVPPTKSRFSTPSPTATLDDERTVAMSSISESQPPQETVSQTTTNIVIPLNNIRSVIGLFAVALVTLLGLVLVLTNIDISTDDTTDTSSNETNTINEFAPIALNDATIPADNILILVAELEPVGVTAEVTYARFITDDLRRQLEQNSTANQISVRTYPGIITSYEQAISAAEENNAVIIIWGFYTDEFARVDIQVGSLDPFEYNQFERDEIERVTNITVQINDVFNQSVSYFVVNSLSTLFIADGDGFKSLQMGSIASAQNSIPADVFDDSISGMLFEAGFQVYILQNFEAGLEIHNQALQRDPSPLLYGQRALLYLQFEDQTSAFEDLATARRLGPVGWTMPDYIELAYELDQSEAIEKATAIIDRRPTDWYAYTIRGSVYYSMGEFELAKTDFEAAIGLNPPVNFPYTYAALLAIREGRFFDMVDTMQTIVRLFPDPSYNTRLFSATFGESPQFQDIIISTVTNLALGQYQELIDATSETEALLSQTDLEAFAATEPQDASLFADLYMLRGLALCNLGEYKQAQEAYTNGIILDSSILMLYLARLEVAHYNGDSEQEQADVDVLLAATNMHPQLYEAILAAERDELTCENYFEFERPTTDES